MRAVRLMSVFQRVWFQHVWKGAPASFAGLMHGASRSFQEEAVEDGHLGRRAQHLSWEYH